MRPHLRWSRATWLSSLTAVLVLGGAIPASAAAIRVFPPDFLVLNPVYPDRGYFDLMVPTIAVVTGPSESFILRGARIDLLRSGRPVSSRSYVPEEFELKSRRLASAPAQFFRDTQFIDAGSFQLAFGSKVHFSASSVMRGNELLVLTEQYFAFDREVDQLRVTVTGLENRHPRILSIAIPLREYKSPIAYHSPLRGNWLRASNPILNSHHRFNPPAEFAIDLFKVDGNGVAYSGHHYAAENWYAYGEPVLAAADGEVVNVISDAKLDRSFLWPRPGETEEQRSARAGNEMEQLVYGAHARYPEAVGGNSIVLKHRVGGLPNILRTDT